jgi:hypothetical protein
MAKILRITLIVLFSISAIITIMFYAGGTNTIELAGGTKIETYPKATDLLLVWTFILTGFAVGITILFPVIHMIKNPKNAKKGLMGIAALAVIVVIAYGLASSEILEITNADLAQYNVPSTLRFAGMMLNSAYAFSFLALAAIAYSEIAKALK